MLWVRWRTPFICALIAVNLMAVTDLCLDPLYQRQGGDWLSWIIGVVRTLELPGLFIAETTQPRFMHHLGWGRWVVMILLNVPIVMLSVAILRRVWCRRSANRVASRVEKLPAASTDNQSDGVMSSDRPSRRDLLLGSRRVAVAGMAGVAGYAMFGEIRRPVVTRQIFAIRDLPQTLSGLRVLQLSDIHHGPWTSIDFVREVIAQANAEQPDLIFLTGDYVHQSPAFIEPVVRELSTLRAKIGVIATLGNHDWWENGDQTIAAFSRTNIPLIDNHRVFLTAERTIEKTIGSRDARSALCIAGVGDLWEDPPLYDSALGGVSPETPRVLLSHNPDVAEEKELLKMNPRIDLMLSGHTHGGQVALPFIGPIITPSKYGVRYASGLVKGPICPVYVNRGIGTTIVPVRMRVRPEIAVIQLQRA
jgi:predicted MPP superfamily phosphohydrolase